ncbi:thioredoxin H-type [Cladochytrium replicatum]|nr:thioredoxin H-type [Cladochytrium replicatum]
MTVVKVNSEEEFKKLVNDPAKVTFVDFYAEWCGPCKVISPVFHDHAKEFTSDKAQFLQVDVDQLEKVSMEAGIQAMPTFQAYKDGKIVNELRGADKPRLDKLVKKELGLLPAPVEKVLEKGNVNVIESVEDWNKALKEKVVFVDFFAEWCGPCKVIYPKIVGYAKQYTNALFVKVDVDELPEIAAPAGIQAMPTFHVYIDGKKVGEVMGAVPAKIEGLLNTYVPQI